MTHEADTSAIRILLVDDHELFLAGLRLLLEREPELIVIGEARTRNEALEAAQSLPDIILLDLDLGSDSGIDVLADLRKDAEGTRVQVLTGMPDPQLHFR